MRTIAENANAFADHRTTAPWSCICVDRADCFDRTERIDWP